MTYHAARIQEFNAMVATGMYGGALTVGVTSYNVVASGVRKSKLMATSAWQPDNAATFTMLRTDFTAAAMTDRSDFTYSGDTFQILDITDDDKEPTIRFTAKLKK